MNSESRQTVQYFCMMDDAALGALCATLPLTALIPHLSRVQHYYRTQEHRDPCYFELRLLEALAALTHHAPNSVRISSLTAQEEQLRIFRDICHKWQVLGKNTPPSLYELLSISGRYLARAGITPHYATLRASTHEQFALTAPNNSGLTLSLDGITATLSPAPIPPVPNTGVLLLFTPTHSDHAAAEYADFLSTHRSLGLCPIAAVGSEGVLPHLLATNGATLDLTSFMEEQANEIPASLGAHTLLFTASEQTLPTLFAKGLPLTLLGTLNQAQKLAFVYRGNTLTSPTLGLLRSLRAEHIQNVIRTVSDAQRSDPTPRITQDEHTLLGGICVPADSAHAVLILATELARRGAILTQSALSIVLECPLYATEACIGDALSLALGLHRATCELTLPTAHSALLTTEVKAPRLCVFLAARKGTPRQIEFPVNWQNARNLFYGD